MSIDLKAAMQVAKDFLKAGGWALFEFESAEPVYRLVVGERLYGTRREAREIVVDREGVIVKFGHVEDLRSRPCQSGSNAS